MEHGTWGMEPAPISTRSPQRHHGGGCGQRVQRQPCCTTPSSCFSTPALHGPGLIPRDSGNRVQPIHPNGGTGALHLPLEPRRGDMKMKLQHTKKKAPQQKRSCCQPPHGESSTAESGTGLVTKTEAALQVMNSRHPPEQKPIPVKTQTKCQQKHLGFGALWSSVSLRKSSDSTDSPVVYTCIAAIIPGKTNSQKSSGMSVQAATSAPKPHRGCSSCILAPNGLRGQRGIYSHC